MTGTTGGAVDELAQEVPDLLQPGEQFRAAVLVSRADPGTSVPMTRAAMSPFRVRLRRSVSQERNARRGVQGQPGSLAFGLVEHIVNVTDPRLLVLTDRRLLVLSRRRRLSRPGPPLRLLWECPRTKLASTTEAGGRLRLTFTDRSAVNLLTPSAGVQPFLAG
jgi:hypothetical protein